MYIGNNDSLFLLPSVFRLLRRQSLECTSCFPSLITNNIQSPSALHQSNFFPGATSVGLLSGATSVGLLSRSQRLFDISGRICSRFFDISDEHSHYFFDISDDTRSVLFDILVGSAVNFFD